MGGQIIRVANIIEEGRYGGPQARICNVAERLKTEGIETLIICPFQDSERFYSEAAKRKVEMRRIGLHRLSRSKGAIIRYFLTLPTEIYSLYRILKNEDIDIVHCNSARQIKGIMAGRLAGKKVIWHLNDTLNPLIIKGLFSLTSMMAIHFIAAGERVRQYYLKRFPLNRKPVKIIQAPVDTFYFAPRLVEPDMQLASVKGLKVVSIGNINPAKAYEYFVEAASYLCDQSCLPTVGIVGAYNDTQSLYFYRLQNMAKNFENLNFQFYGPSSNIRAILEAVDIYVCSSIHEASPISVWEAMAMGKAIVSTDVGDVKRFIRDGENGFVVPTKNSRALAEKIKILLNDAALRETFGARARATAVEHLDISVCVRKHKDLYQHVLGKYINA